MINYIATSNHIHLLVKDTGDNVIPRSMQLIAGRVAQEYNHRKQRKGAFWEDRYHATAVDTEDYLARCMTYIDLNMVRAGVVSHPAEWEDSGYFETQHPPQRYSIINHSACMELFELKALAHFQQARREWADHALTCQEFSSNAEWSNSLAVGHPSFVEHVKKQLGPRAANRKVETAGDMYLVRETEASYTGGFDVKNRLLSSNNGYFWS